MSHDIQFKRVYDKAYKKDGVRVLADRLWPRGVKKTDLKYDEWAKALCPSNELRKAWHDDEISFTEFKKHYRAELKQQKETLKHLAKQAEKQPVTLLTATKDPTHSHLVVLKAELEKQIH